jgi:hypothetical protein
MMEWWFGWWISRTCAFSLPKQIMDRSTDARIMPKVADQHSIIPTFHYSKASQETAEPLLFSPAEPVE